MLMRSSKIVALASLGLVFSAASAIARPAQQGQIDQVVNALHQVGPNFFR
jgi:hypothetical protein